ncbi:hypothetical protein ML401_11600 [Bradyrhizobium sp. 62B]|nr:hypothetical protein ML401_11600 [Bradyrhizobium sp. 62B]
MLLGVAVLLCAVRRPLTRALLTAPIWIEPLLTVIALALRRPLELTEAANFAAWSRLAMSRWLAPPT